MSYPQPRAPKLFFILIGLLLLSCLAIAQTSDKFCNNYLCVNVTINTDETADVEVSVVKDGAGWLGFGVGKSMTTADLMVLWANADDNSITLSRRKTSSYTQPQVVANQSAITSLISTAASATNPTFKFRRPQVLENSNLNTQQTEFVWAYGTAKPAGKTPDTLITQHTRQGAFNLDLTKTVANPLGATSLTLFDRLVYAHGTIMFVAWGILVPVGVFIARFGRHLKSWVRIHQLIQSLGSGVLTFTGFWIGFVQSSGRHLQSPHQIIGLTIMCALVVQIFLGLYIHHKFDPNRTHRPVRNWVHRFFGPAILILAFVQVPLGLREYDAPRGWEIAFYVWIGVLVVIALGLQIWYMMRRDASVNENTGEKSEISPELQAVLPTGGSE